MLSTVSLLLAAKVSLWMCYTCATYACTDFFPCGPMSTNPTRSLPWPGFDSLGLEGHLAPNREQQKDINNNNVLSTLSNLLYQLM